MEMSLRPETEARVQQALQSGHFENVDALIATAMDVLRDGTPADIRGLSKLNDDGIASAETEKDFGEEEAHAFLASVRASWK